MGWYFFSSVAILKEALKFLARSEVYLAQTIPFPRHKKPGSHHHSGLKSKGKNKPVFCPQVPSGRGHWSRQWHMSESLGLSCRNRKRRLVRQQAVQNITALPAPWEHWLQLSCTFNRQAGLMQPMLMISNSSKGLQKPDRDFWLTGPLSRRQSNLQPSTTTVCFQCWNYLCKTWLWYSLLHGHSLELAWSKLFFFPMPMEATKIKWN